MHDSPDIRPTDQTRRRRRIYLLLLFLSLMLALGILAVWEYWFRLPIGEGPAGATVPKEVFTGAWTPRPVLLVGLGDSITAGLGARTGYGYFDRLLRNPSEEWPEMDKVNLQAVFPDLQFTNLAMSGSTSLDHEQRQLPRVPLAGSNTLGIVVLTTGGNDLIHSYGRTPPKEGALFGATWEQAQTWISNFAIRLERMLDVLNEHFPGGCQVYLADIYDPTDGTGDAQRVGIPSWPDGIRIHSAYNDIIHAEAARRANVHLVELHSAFLGHGLACRRFWQPHYRSDDPHYWFWTNLEDPNERGYDAIRRVFLESMVATKAKLH